MVNEMRMTGEGIVLSDDHYMRLVQLKREAERLERMAKRNEIYAEHAKEASEDYDQELKSR